MNAQTDRNINCVSTSPSVYANFHGIQATDQCGGIDISSTMIAFAPGELTTIAGPLGLGDGAGDGRLTTKSFNFNDLPCPPQSVMVNMVCQVCYTSS